MKIKCCEMLNFLLGITSLTNIRLDFQFQLWTNTFGETPMPENKGPILTGINVIKLFSSFLSVRQNKRECLSLESYFSSWSLNKIASDKYEVYSLTQGIAAYPSSPAHSQPCPYSFYSANIHFYMHRYIVFVTVKLL